MKLKIVVIACLRRVSRMAGIRGGAGQGHPARSDREIAVRIDRSGGEERRSHRLRQVRSGLLSCWRLSGTGWSAPAGVKIEDGSVGFQIGGSETDASMLVMNKRGVEKLRFQKFPNAGGDPDLLPVPVFAVISLDSATLRPDEDANEELYSAKLTNRQIVMGKTKMPTDGRALAANLNATPRESNSQGRKQ